MFEEQKHQRRRRSKAWVYYAILAVLSLFLIPSIGFTMVLGAMLFGLYATYLFRGGRFVVWIW